MTYLIQIPSSLPNDQTYVARSGERIRVSEPSKLKTHPWFAFSNEDDARLALIEATNTLRLKPTQGAFTVEYKLSLIQRLHQARIINIT